VTLQGYTALFYAAVAGNFAGMFLAFYNVKRFGATAAAMTDYVIPVVAGLGGILLLGEQITRGMIGGMLLVAAGLTLINRFRQAAPKPV
jgi:drug/metabolite transporter (DMT)-like permease